MTRPKVPKGTQLQGKGAMSPPTAPHCGHICAKEAGAKESRAPGNTEGSAEEGEGLQSCALESRAWIHTVPQAGKKE